MKTEINHFFENQVFFKVLIFRFLDFLHRINSNIQMVLTF